MTSPAARSDHSLEDISHPERGRSFWYYNTSKRGGTLNLDTAYSVPAFGDDIRRVTKETLPLATP